MRGRKRALPLRGQEEATGEIFPRARRSKRLQALSGPKLIGLPCDALACIVYNCDFPSWLALRETCATLKSIVDKEVERQAFSWMNFQCVLLCQRDDEDDCTTAGGVCICARKERFGFVADEDSFFRQAVEHMSVAVNELAPDTIYDEEKVRALLVSSAGSAKGVLSGQFEWSIEYDFDRQASSEDGANLFKDVFSLLSGPHVCKDNSSELGTGTEVVLHQMQILLLLAVTSSSLALSTWKIHYKRVDGPQVSNNCYALKIRTHSCEVAEITSRRVWQSTL